MTQGINNLQAKAITKDSETQVKKETLNKSLEKIKNKLSLNDGTNKLIQHNSSVEDKSGLPMKQNILNKKDKLDWEQLIQVINSQDLQGLKDVIKKISETNQRKVKTLLNHSENSSLTPFEQAVEGGSIKIIKYLIDNRWEFNIQAKSKSGKTSLEIAIDRLSQSDTEENQQIVTYLRGNIMTQENDLEYKESL